MSSKLKRFLSLLLAFAMVLSIVPVSAEGSDGAVVETATSEETLVAQIERTGEKYTSLDAAFKAAQDADTIKLLDNVDEVVRLSVSDGNSVPSIVLDLDGYTWDCGYGTRINAVNLTVKNGTIGDNRRNKETFDGEVDVFHFGGHAKLPSKMEVENVTFYAELHVNNMAPSDEELGLLATSKSVGRAFNATEVVLWSKQYDVVTVQKAAYLTVKGGLFIGGINAEEGSFVTDNRKSETTDSGETVDITKAKIVTIMAREEYGYTRTERGVTITFVDPTPVVTRPYMEFTVGANYTKINVQKLVNDEWETVTPGDTSTSTYQHTFEEPGSVTFRVDWDNNGTYDRLVVLVKGDIREVDTKEELKNAIATANDGTVIKLTADIDYGTDHLEITKSIILDLGGHTLTTRARNYGLALKNEGIIVTNGKLNHAGTVAAIKVWSADEISNLEIDVTGTSSKGNTINGIVIQKDANGVRTLKNVKIHSTSGQGVAVGIETYECGNANTLVIGNMENVTIDAKDKGMLISAPCGTATNCDIKGGVSGIEICLKGNYSAWLQLVNSKVYGGTQAIYAHDELSSNTEIVNNGTLKLLADYATKFTTSENDVLLNKVFAHVDEDTQVILPDLTIIAKNTTTNKEYYNLHDALSECAAGETVVLLKDVDLAGIEWAPVGGDSVYFAGEFDGNDHKVVNLTQTTGARMGLFGLIEKAYIHDLTLENVSFTVNADNARVGAIAGNLQYWNVIENVTIDGINVTVNGDDGLIGSVTGYARKSQLGNVDVNNAVYTVNGTGNVIGGHTAYGRAHVWDTGVTGNNAHWLEGTVQTIDGVEYVLQNYFEDCDVSGIKMTLNGTGTEAGGFIGSDTYNNHSNFFVNCDVTGLDVTAAEGTSQTVGGFMAWNNGTTSAGTVKGFNGCSVTGTIKGANGIYGGFVGQVGGRACEYYNATANVNITAAGTAGGFVGKTQAYSTHKYTFSGCTATGNVSGTVAGGFTGANGMSGDGKSVFVEYNGCTANGSVNGTSISGGFIGEVNTELPATNWNTVDSTGNLTLTGNTASPVVNGAGTVGYLIGYLDGVANGDAKEGNTLKVKLTANTPDGSDIGTGTRHHINISDDTVVADIELQKSVAKVEDEYYESLFEAVAAANAIEGGATVVMLANTELGEKLTISGDVTIEGEYTITRADTYTGTLFEVAAGATLTLDDGLTIDGGNHWTMDMETYNADLMGMVQVQEADYDKYFTLVDGEPVSTAHMITVNGGTVNLNAVTVQNEFGTTISNAGVVKSTAAGSVVTLTRATIKHIASVNSSGVVVHSHTGCNTTITINDGTVIDGNHVGGNHGLFLLYPAVMTMKGGEIKNTTGVNSNGVVVGVVTADSKFIMEGGTICSSSSVWGKDNQRNPAVYLHNSGEMLMTGGTICHNIGKEYGGGIGSYKATSILTITGGSVIGNISLNNDNRAPAMERGDDVDSVGTVLISGGTYGHDVSKWCIPGYECVQKEDGLWVVQEKIYAVVEVEAMPGVWLTTEITEENWADLKAALGENTGLPVKVTLMSDIELGEMLTVAGNTEKIILGNGHTITRKNDYTGTLFTVSAGTTLTLDGGLTIDGGNNYAFNSELYNADLKAMVSIPKENAAKYFTPEAGAPVATAYMIVLTKGTSADAPGGTVNLNDVTIQNNYSNDYGIVSANAAYTEVNLTGAKISHVACTANSGVVVKASGAGIKVNMNAGTVIDSNHVGGNHGIFYVYSGAKLTMNGGEVKNTTGWNSNGTVVGLYGGTFIMNDGTICSNSSIYGPSNGRNAAVYLHANSVMKMNGGTICHNTGRSRGGIDSSKSTSKLTISGGEVLDNVSLAGNTTADIGGTVGTWEITGGTFTQDVTNWLAPNYGLETVVREDGVTEYTVTDEIAEVNGVTYHSVAEAVKAANAGDTVKVLASHKPSVTTVIDKDITLDLNGKSVYGYATVNPIIRVLADVTVTGNGMIDSANYGDGYCFIVGSNEGSGNLTIEDGTFKGTTTAASVTKGTLTIRGGDYRVKPYEDSYDYLLNCIDANYQNGTAEIEVKGGVFTRFDPMNNAAEGANTNFVAEGYTSETKDEGATYAVRKLNYVAQVGETKYEDLKEAIEACTNGETVKLIANITYDSDDVVYAHGGATGFGDYDQYNPSIVYIGGTKGATEAENQPSNVNAVIDLNGHTITNNAAAYTFLIMDNAKLTFTDSVGTGSITNTADMPVIWSTGTNTVVIINSGKYVADNYGSLIWATHSGDLVINGGEFKTTAADPSYLIMRNEKDRQNSAYFISGKSTIKIAGGTFDYNPEATLDDNTDPYTEFNAVVEGCKAIDNGNGTWTVRQNVVTISNVDELLAFNSAVTGNTKYQSVKVAANPDVLVLLTADLDLTDSGFAPIGNGAANAFSGTFDGQGHTISNMTLVCNYYRGVGFFRSLGKGAVIMDLTFENADVNNGAATDANHFYGVVAGFSNNVTLDNVDVKNSTLECKYAGAAMIGCIEGASTIKNCDIENVTVKTTSIRTSVFGILGNSANGHSVTMENNSVKDVDVVAIVDGEVKAIRETLNYNEWAAGTEYTESTYVAQIGETKYSTLYDAVAAAENGATITLIGNVVRAETLVVNKDVTIDLNGKTVSAYKTLVSTPVMRILSNVTVKNGTVDGTAGESSYAFIVGNGETAGALNIVGGTYKGDVSAISVTKGTANISGGYFEATEFEGAHEFTLNCIDSAYNNKTASYNITGGRFYKFNPENNAAEGADTNFLTAKYTAVQDGDCYEVMDYVRWVKAELLAGRDVKLDRDIVITDYSYVDALNLPSNGNGKYDERHGNGAIFHVIKPGVELDLNGHDITWDAHDDAYCNKRQVSLFMVTITGNAGETSNLSVKDSVGNANVNVNGMGTGMYVAGVGAQANINGGTWKNYPCECGASNIFLYPSHGGTLNISAGIFEQVDSEYLLGWKGSSEATDNNGVGTDYDETKVSVTGGTFVGFNPEETKFFDVANSGQETINGVAKGYKAVDNKDGTWTVQVAAVEYAFQQSTQLGLIEPWFMKSNLYVKRGESYLTDSELNALVDFGVYFVRASELGNPEEMPTTEMIIGSASTVHYSKNDTSFKAVIEQGTEGYMITASYVKGIYTYELDDSIYVLYYIEDAEGIHYDVVKERNLLELATKSQGDTRFTETERAVYTRMVGLYEAVTAYRATFSSIPVMPAHKAPKLTVGQFSNYQTGYTFKHSINIVVIEPWGIRLNGYVDGSVEFEEAGAVVFYDKNNIYASEPNVETLVSNPNAYVFSTENGDAITSTSGSYTKIETNYTKNVYTYQLDDNAYVVFFVKIDGVYHFGEVKTRNVLDNAQSQASNPDCPATERAVYQAMVDMYKDVVEHRAKFGY